MKSKLIITEENLFFAFLVLLVAVAGVLLIYLDNKQREEVHTLINNPTFRGEVVNMESDWIGGFSPIHGYNVYKMHIVGEYQDCDKTIQVDRVFVVPYKLYEEFNVGDEIAYMP